MENCTNFYLTRLKILDPFIYDVPTKIFIEWANNQEKNINKISEKSKLIKLIESLYFNYYGWDNLIDDKNKSFEYGIHFLLSKERREYIDEKYK